MRNEAEFKRIFCRSIREVGGYTIRLAAPTISGIPDLYCIYPGYMPVLLEAKFLGELGDSFCRKIPYTLLQLHWLEETNKAQPHSSYGLIGFKYKKETYAVLTPSSQTYIRNDFLKENVYCTYDPKMGIDVKKLFTKSKIPKMGKARLLRTLDCDTMGDESTRGF